MVPVILTCLMFLVASPATAAIYYVATDGNDTNAGTSEGAPLRTIKKGVSKLLSPGDTVYVKNGTYQETGELRIPSGGTESAPITLSAYPGHAPVLEFPLEPDENVLGSNTLLLQRLPGHNLPIAWVIIEGLTIHRGNPGIKGYNCTNCIFRNNWLKNQYRDGILLDSSIDTVIENNIISDAGQPGKAHGLYLTGSRLRIRKNIIYSAEKYGIQMRGDRTYNPVDHAGPEYALTVDAIIERNVLAYSHAGAGVVVWDTNDDNMRVENNIFYENWQDGPGTYPNGINCISCTGATGVQIRNNLFYASGTGALVDIDAGLVEGVNYTKSGNVTNVSPPGFSNGGSNAIPGSPDFSLTQSSPAIGMARANEFTNNPTLAVGAFATVGAPTAFIKQNKITLEFSTPDGPIQVPSTAGVSVTCTPTHTTCPDSPTVSASSVFEQSNSTTLVEVTIGGIVGNACTPGQTWKISYSSTSGAWTNYTNIGPSPGLHQKVFTFTNIVAADLCGGAVGSYPGAPYIYYSFNDNSGVTASNSGSGGPGLNGTLINGASWVPGNFGSAVATTSGSTQYVGIPYGSGVNPSTQSLTIAFAVNVPPGSEGSIRYEMGPTNGSNQRGYIGSRDGTWRVGIQGNTPIVTGPSNLAVDTGWNHLCLVYDASVDTIRLYKNGVAGTGGALYGYTSFTFASNFTLGRVDANAASGGTYEDLLVYQTVEDCAAIYAAFSTPSAPAGTFAQAAIRFQGVYLDTAGSPITFGVAINQPQEVVENGAVAVLIQAHCQTGADCQASSFIPQYAINGASTYTAVPQVPTADKIWFWGSDVSSTLNSGATTARLTGSCTLTNGITVLSQSQALNVDLPDDGCVVLRYIFRFASPAGTFYDIRLVHQSRAVFTGGYALARVIMVPPASSPGF